MKLMLAKSLAGHDKNHIYVVYKEENNLLFLVNGDNKPISKPKKKKKMHVSLIKRFPMEIETRVDDIENLRDEDIVTIIKAYNEYLNSVNRKNINI